MRLVIIDLAPDSFGRSLLFPPILFRKF